VLYPERAPLRTFTLTTDPVHTVHVQEWGNPEGIPVALLHGGPGSGSSILLRRAINPNVFRVISPDQRGAGSSSPHGDIQNNSTPDLVADMERIRLQLGIDRWLLVGGSWGATLALATALAHPESVSGLVLRASFLARQQDIDGFFSGAPAVLLDGWRRLPELDQDAALEIVQAWFAWEHSKSGDTRTPAALQGAELQGAELQGAALSAMHCRYRIQSHYLRNGCWLQDPPLLDRLESLSHLRIALLHGAEDRVCPLQGAIELRSKLSNSTLTVVPGAGHDPTHPNMVRAMVQTLDNIAQRC
jgi:proline iminopeptidase